jgi:hypothetical protein
MLGDQEGSGCRLRAFRPRGGKSLNWVTGLLQLDSRSQHGTQLSMAPKSEFAKPLLETGTGGPDVTFPASTHYSPSSNE